MPLTIAIDGPVGAGKSTVSDAVAHALGILHLDTGAMYRAVGLTVLEKGIDPDDMQAVCALCEQGGVLIDVAYENGLQKTFANGKDVTPFIRTQEVGQAASHVSRYPAVRRMLVARQRELSLAHDMLVDGRDIGTVVLPNAALKVFLTAQPEERARRRMLELRAKGDQTPFEDVLAEVNARDLQDMTRETDPLRQADDAVVVDATHMNFDQTVQHILSLAEARK